MRARTPSRVHVGAAAALDDLAALHDQVAVGELGGEVVVLLDQHDRHALRLAGDAQAGVGEHADDAADVLDDRRLDALGRLVEHEQASAPAASARAMASCCCWPPERSPPRRCSICFSTGNSSNSSLRHRRAARLVARPICRFSCDREASEDLAALRHVADAAAHALVRRLAGDVGAAEADRSRAHRHDAHQALQQRRLADAVAAEDRRSPRPRPPRSATLRRMCEPP